MNTLVGILHERAEHDPDQLAIIAKKRGRWIPTTVGDLVARVGATAVGLVDLGITPGARVALMLGNVPDWLVVDLAVQSVGAISVALPVAGDRKATADLLRGVDISLVVVDDPTDAVLLSGHFDDRAQHSTVRFVCLGDDADGFTGLDTVIRNGHEEIRRTPDAFRRLIELQDPEAPATATFTSGAGGRERAIVHQGGALVAQARRVATYFGLGPQDVTIAALHPSDPFERAVTIYPVVVSGAVLAYPESTSTIGQSILEVRPTSIHLPVDRVRAATASVHGRFRRNRGIKRLVGSWWDRAAFEPVRAGRPPSGLAVRLVGRPALKSLGWENLRSLLITGARVPLDVLVTMQALGVPVYGGYGTVETGLVATWTPRSTEGLGVLDGLSATLHDNQLSITGEGMSAGELGGVERSAPVPTGDLARLSEGSVVIRGPEKSIVVTPDGRTVLAAEVEAALRDSSYIALAAVRPDGNGLRADIEVDFDSLSDWAAERKLHFTTFSSLVANDEVRSLIADEVARLAADVEHHNLLTSPFQQGRDITRTRSTIQRGPVGDVARGASSTEFEPAAIE